MLEVYQWICLLFNNFIVDHYCFNCLITICVELSNEHCSLKYDFIFSHNSVYTGIRFIQDSVKTGFTVSSRKDVIANHDQGGHHGFLIDFVEYNPMNIPTKIGINWPSGF